MFCPKFVATTWTMIWGKALPGMLCDHRLESKLNQYLAIMRKDISLTKYGCTNSVNDKEGASVVVEREMSGMPL